MQTEFKIQEPEQIFEKYITTAGQLVKLKFYNKEEATYWLCGEELGFLIVSQEPFDNFNNISNRHMAMINKETVTDIKELPYTEFLH